MRENGTQILKNGVTQNKFVWFALALSLVIVLGAVYNPFFANILSLTPPGFTGWLVVIAGSFAPMIISQALKELKLVI